MDNVLFKIKFYRDEEPRLQLCVPQSYLLTLLYKYHDEIMSAHQGATRTYLTLREKYWSPHLYQNVHAYIRCCYTCQTVMEKSDQTSASYMRIPYNYRPMSRLSMDIKEMPNASEGFKYILVVACEFTNYVVTAPLRDISARSVAEALIHRVFFVFGPPEQIICDQGTQLVSKLMLHIYERLHIDVKVVSPGNHGSLRAERFIGTISKLLQKTMARHGHQWVKHLQSCTYSHNTFHSQAIGTSPYNMVYLHDPPKLTDWEPVALDFGTVDTKRYLSQLKARYQTITEHAVKLRMEQQQKMLEKQRRLGIHKHIYAKGDLVYFYAPRLTELQTNSRKFKAHWIGPLKIAQILDDTHVIVTDLQGKELKALGAVHTNLLKPYMVHLGEFRENRLVTHSNVETIGRLPIKRLRPHL